MINCCSFRGKGYTFWREKKIAKFSGLYTPFSGFLGGILYIQHVGLELPFI